MSLLVLLIFGEWCSTEYSSRSSPNTASSLLPLLKIESILYFVCMRQGLETRTNLLRVNSAWQLLVADVCKICPLPMIAFVAVMQTMFKMSEH